MREPDAEIEKAFENLQELLKEQAPELTDFSEREHTVVVIPSLTLDNEQLEKIHGISYYEERMLYLLLLLRQPKARVVLVTSQQVDHRTIDYVLRLLPNKELESARDRLVCLSTNDWTPRPLSAKVIERPWLVKRIRGLVKDPSRAHLVTFNMTHLEMRLAVTLGIPVVGCDPRLEYLGTKSGNRNVFREAGVEFPDGIEDLRSGDDVAGAIEEVWARNPGLSRVLVKLNEGFSGEGNAILDLRELHRLRPGEAPKKRRLSALSRALESLEFQGAGETWENFSRQFAVRGGIVEAFVEGDVKRSPSVQLKVDVLEKLHVLSTHDQVLGGVMDQVFLGCRFPADDAYRRAITERSRRVGEVLKAKGVSGRFGVDFMAVETAEGWDLTAIEINIRRGGTTHPFASMHYLVQGSYDEESGRYFAPDGSERCYQASDNVEEDFLAGLLPVDLHTILEHENLGYDHAAMTGNVFHMLGAASQFRKIGYTSISTDAAAAAALFEDTREKLRRASAEPVLEKNVS